MEKIPQLNESQVSYHAVDDKNILSLIQAIRNGINYSYFVNLAKKSPFSLPEWSGFLHLSERTMQRYKKEEKPFDSIYAERILQISMLNKYGIEVFGNNNKFNSWLETSNVYLGGIEPKKLLDSSFGIDLIKNELTRIEQGILA